MVESALWSKTTHFMAARKWGWGRQVAQDVLFKGTPPVIHIFKLGLTFNTNSSMKSSISESIDEADALMIKLPL
jgi:hypothetical protein